MSIDYAKRYELIVGLEVHAELRTATKIFCSCRSVYGAAPNTHVCPVCLGLPGTLPRLNRRAVELAIAAGLALECDIQADSRFDRKNYFYPDLPKGYQITQYEYPVCLGGGITVETEEGERRIGITRIHLEEDAGKLIHGEDGTKIDYNRCGVPLIEIVSEPDIRSAAEARAYLSALRERLVFAGVSDCRMNEGSMRCDVNLSVRRRGDTALGQRTEIKNINSIAFAGKAIAYEFARQAEILEKGGSITPQTRRYDEDNDRTVLMREKESAADYRYFPEPDLPSLHVDAADIDAVRKSLPEMPDVRRCRFTQTMDIPADAARQLTQTPQIADYFDAAAAVSAYPRQTANLLIGEILPGLGEDTPALPPGSLARIADMAGERKISAASARKLITLCADGRDPAVCAGEQGMLMITDPSKIAALVENALRENPTAAQQLADGKVKAKQAIIGAVMRASRGSADAAAVSEEIDRQCGGK